MIFFPHDNFGGLLVIGVFFFVLIPIEWTMFLPAEYKYTEGCAALSELVIEGAFFVTDYALFWMIQMYRLNGLLCHS